MTKFKLRKQVCLLKIILSSHSKLNNFTCHHFIPLWNECIAEVNFHHRTKNALFRRALQEWRWKHLKTSSWGFLQIFIHLFFLYSFQSQQSGTIELEWCSNQYHFYYQSVLLFFLSLACWYAIWKIHEISIDLTHLSILIAQRLRMLAVHRRTSREIQNWQRIHPNGHDPVSISI